MKISKKTGRILDIAECFATAAFVITLAFTFVFKVVEVVGHSMENTLFEGDRLVVHKLFYTPEKGDIVLINSDVLGESIIKRIIAVSNESVTVDLKNNQVSVDGNIIEENYVKEEILKNNGNFSDEFYNKEKGVYEYIVPFGYVFVMGDNRNNSTDSRKIGLISKDEIVGKVVYRITSKQAETGKIN